MAKKRKKQREPGTRKLNWGLALALVTAFLMGGVVGAVVERERVLGTGDSGSAASTQTPPDWFKAGDLSVCPPLQRWNAAAAASYAALAQGTTDWSASQATQLQQSSEATASLQTLLPLVNPAGTAGIQSLIAHEAKVREALTNATSLAGYTATRKALDTDQITHGLVFLGQAVRFCPTG